MDSATHDKLLNKFRDFLGTTGVPTSSAVFAEIDRDVRALPLDAWTPVNFPRLLRRIGRSLKGQNVTWIAFLAPIIVFEDQDSQKIIEGGLLLFESAYAGAFAANYMRLERGLDGPVVSLNDASGIPAEFVQDGLDAFWIAFFDKGGESSG